MNLDRFDIHLKISLVMLGLVTLPLLSFVVLVPAVCVRFVFFGLPPDWYEPEGPFLIIGVLGVAGMLGVAGVVQACALWGLLRVRTWGWYLGLVVGALWCTFGLLPLGAYVLYALLRAPSRALFTESMVARGGRTVTDAA